MRPTPVVLATLLISATLSAQSPSPASPWSSSSASPCPQHTASAGRLGFDPYNPSDLAIIRRYGGALLAQAPIGTLLALDPYVPTEAALLRQVGGGIPVWPYTSFGWFPPAAPMAPCVAARGETDIARSTGLPAESTAAPLTSFHEVFALLQQRTPTEDGASSDVAVSRADAIGRGNEPARGITIQYDDRLWSSAGRAVRFTDSDFVRVGERGGIPIYMRADSRGGARTAGGGARRDSRAGEDDRVIYVPTVPGVVAPFRVVP